MKYAIKNRKVIFATHEIEYNGRKRLLFSEEEKDNFVSRLQERGIDYIITEVETPTQEQIGIVEDLRTWDTRKVKEKLEEVV